MTTQDNTQPIETVDITPSWVSTIKILCLTLENGTPKGKAMAREELYKIGEVLDQLKEKGEN